MSDLRDLYQEVILDHTKHPRNFGTLEHANCKADGFNPLCGDRLSLFLSVEDGVVKDVRFQGSGCAISTASASMMTESIKGKTRAEAEVLFEKFHQMLTGKPGIEFESDELGKLAVFSGVKEFPVRVKCATLAWHTLNAALKNEREPASTE
ncbi:MAG: SUF system NifU family Fe-S cluster assembly protein [Acidobacteria bacterium]|nr:SUF system NifU family Fe-S cluster assembly protein [Acidobacteriota bacterium]MCI0624511.1 SUF system NifU family Fe-S cluster assembly protein [Acidobacteriota bacterium]MCI0720913.1 SUF system NifU family Fe-S cluster assembly protein [Acidobacteriota bacterium]